MIFYIDDILSSWECPCFKCLHACRQNLARINIIGSNTACVTISLKSGNAVPPAFSDSIKAISFCLHTTPSCWGGQENQPLNNTCNTLCVCGCVWCTTPHLVLTMHGLLMEYSSTILSLWQTLTPVWWGTLPPPTPPSLSPGEMLRGMEKVMSMCGVGRCQSSWSQSPCQPQRTPVFFPSGFDV